MVATTGPGVLNAATAAAQAWSDSVPLLLIAPGMPLGHPVASTGYLHEMLDQRLALSGVVERAVRVERTPSYPASWPTRSAPSPASGPGHVSSRFRSTCSRSKPRARRC